VCSARATVVVVVVVVVVVFFRLCAEESVIKKLSFCFVDFVQKDGAGRAGKQKTNKKQKQK